MQVVARDCFQAAAGQFELIGKGSALVDTSTMPNAEAKCLAVELNGTGVGIVTGWVNCTGSG